YEYDSDNKLKAVVTYQKTAAGVEYESSHTAFVGDKNKEIADYNQSLDSDGNKLDTTVYYYKGGKRASDGYYRDPKEKAVTYWSDPFTKPGDLDSDGDGIKDSARKRSETFYDTTHRIAGEEVIDYVLNFFDHLC
ncbi:MAG: hypothetical protein WCP55_24060, partial [Lentisphaerota bacterium]